MRCAHCNAANPTNASFCEQCGWKLERVCQACKTTLSAEARFCKSCGAPVGAAAPGSPRQSNDSLISVTDSVVGDTLLDGERKTVTMLFADIKNSMELMENLDPEEARAIVDPALKLMADSVHQYDGYEWTGPYVVGVRHAKRDRDASELKTPRARESNR